MLTSAQHPLANEFCGVKTNIWLDFDELLAPVSLAPTSLIKRTTFCQLVIIFWFWLILLWWCLFSSSPSYLAALLCIVCSCFFCFARCFFFFIAFVRCIICESYHMTMESKTNDADAAAHSLMNRFSFVFNSCIIYQKPVLIIYEYINSVCVVFFFLHSWFLTSHSQFTHYHITINVNDVCKLENRSYDLYKR